MQKNIPLEIISIFNREKARLFKERNFLADAVKIIKSRLGNYYVSVIQHYEVETTTSPSSFKLYVLNAKGEKEGHIFAHSRQGFRLASLGWIEELEVYNNQKREGLGPVLLSHAMDLLAKKQLHQIKLIPFGYKMCKKMGWKMNSREAEEYNKSLLRFYQSFGFEEKEEDNSITCVYKRHKQYPKMLMEMEDGYIVYSMGKKLLAPGQSVQQEIKK